MSCAWTTGISTFCIHPKYRISFSHLSYSWGNLPWSDNNLTSFFIFFWASTLLSLKANSLFYVSSLGYCTLQNRLSHVCMCNNLQISESSNKFYFLFTLHFYRKVFWRFVLLYLHSGTHVDWASTTLSIVNCPGISSWNICLDVVSPQPLILPAKAFSWSCPT